jgi:D-alanyl-D-alanine carboxypeptidase
MLLKRVSGTYDGSFAIKRNFATREAHVDPDEFRFVDGLSPDDLVAPVATIAMLRWMNHPSCRAFWWATLAPPNNEGTLRRRLIAFDGIRKSLRIALTVASCHTPSRSFSIHL